ncbi:MAG: hypothetical protein K8963_06815, partial [Proteobacteria bacterium]|nr:hypothetical protein [Pseudomonadota bacterium]
MFNYMRLLVLPGQVSSRRIYYGNALQADTMTNSSTIQTVATRLRALRQRLDQISTDCGREPADVLLLAVSKGHSCQAIEQALAAGQRHFG